ncbi:MAG: GNAT family N-acetyltransferase [Crocinitomicaceae bacterium]|nr:GNAT family N-acetyltransferase [Crocinitomicaceae bacterium]
MNQYTFQQLSDENIKDLPYIFQSAFGKHVDVNYFRKKFDTERFGCKNVGFIAYSNKGEPAAFYGVFPCLVEFQGDLVLVAQSGDTMTHVNHRGKGLFVNLAKQTYDYAQTQGIKIVFGFPNENSYPGFVRKLNWQHKEDLSAFLIRAKCLPWIRAKKYFKISEEFHFAFVRKKLHQFPKGKPFKNSVINNEFGGIQHSEDYFRYKTYHENFLISIEGKSLWVKPEGMHLLIGNIEKCDPNTFLKIIKQLKKFCFWTGIPYLRYQCSPDVEYEAYFSKHGKKNTIKYPVGYVDFGCDFDFGKIKFTASDNDNF